MSAELLIDWREDEEGSDDSSHSPVRDLRTRRNARSITGQVNSVHARVTHVYESLGEMRHIIIADADWDVTRLEAQPVRLKLADGRTYTPDSKIWLRSSARPIFREIKPAKWLRDDPELKGKLQLISHACAQLGCDFEIISDLWYNRQPRLRNANWIRRATRLAPREHLVHVARLITDLGPLPADEIARQSGLDHAGVFAAYALAGLRFCRLDLNDLFDADTVFSRASA